MNKELNNIKNIIVESLEGDKLDRIELESVCTYLGWVNCLIEYKINPTIEDTKELLNLVAGLKETYL